MFIYCVNLHKASSRRGKSYIKSPKWLKNKRETINPKNKKNNNCFQYALTVALNWEKMLGTLKEFQKLNFLLVSMDRKE